MKLSRITTLAILLFTIFALALQTFAQDATAEATIAADLQTYSNENGTASVQFPAGWVSEKDTDRSILSVKLANNASALAKDLFNQDDIFQPGEVHIEVATISLPELISEMPAGTLTLDATPLELLQTLTKQGMPDEFTFGDPGAITINDRPAVRMNLTAGKRGEGQLLLTIDDKKWVKAIILYAASGEGDKWDLTARNILASIQIEPSAEVTQEPVVDSTNEPPTDVQTYISQQGDFTFKYPLNLVFEDLSDGIPNGFTGGKFYSNPELKAEDFANDFKPGELYIDFALTTLNNYTTLLGDVDSSSSPVEILKEVIEKTAIPKLTYGNVQELNVPYGTAAKADMSGTGRGEGRFLLIKRASDGIFLTLVIHAAPGEIQPATDVALSIAASLVLNAPIAESTLEPTAESTAESLALTQTAKTANGLGSLSYPEGWFSRQYGSESVYVANTQTALDKSFGSSLASGEVNILVTVSPTDEYIKQAQLPLNADASPLELLQMTMKVVGDTLKFAAPRETTLVDKRAASVDFTGQGFEGTAWIIEYQKGAIITVQMLTAPREAAQWQSTTLAIIATVRSTD